jgi:hypothetical protein
VLNKLASPGTQGSAAAVASAHQANSTTGKFGKVSTLEAAGAALLAYNKSHNGNFSKFDYANFSLKYFGMALLPPGRQSSQAGGNAVAASAVAAQGSVTLQQSSSCGQTCVVLVLSVDAASPFVGLPSMRVYQYLVGCRLVALTDTLLRLPCMPPMQVLQQRALRAEVAGDQCMHLVPRFPVLRLWIQGMLQQS